ncbi:MAG TPA: 2,3-dihydro-2,3-dihydroxybenzoate dehydrogenase [Solibacterales bacterium]|nr:2,3-dihydro-2,3-dihydroxybenzoate dehydrogenase [Bryobacterales bacterium]
MTLSPASSKAVNTRGREVSRVVLVTGAARGIGCGIARRLSESGMTVVLTDIDEPTLTETARTLAHTVAIPADITRRADVEALIERVESEAGPLYALINNAGVFTSGPIETFREEDWDRTFAVDAKAVFLCSQAAARRMIPRRAGRIVIVSSIAGHIVRTNQIAYCAAKAAAIHFARCLAVELAPHAVTVNCLCPGMTDSEMLRQTAAARGVAIGDFLEMIPAARLATNADHAETVAWLISDAAAHVTGQVISVDGAQSLFHPVTRR